MKEDKNMPKLYPFLCPFQRCIICSGSLMEFAKNYIEPLMQEMLPSGIGELSHKGIINTCIIAREHYNKTSTEHTCPLCMAML